MTKFDLVKLINEKPYTPYNLSKDMHGIILRSNSGNNEVLFFNPKNIGEYIIVNIDSCDVEIDKEKLPNEMKEKLLQNYDKLFGKSVAKFEPLKIKEYDTVELLVEDEKYAKFGIHKGDTGCVMNNNGVQNYIEVDFSGIDKNGEYYGDCISVKIEDLKKIK
ncbi:MAG: hypothetical protein RR140_02255 [Clostridia bacterium]